MLIARSTDLPVVAYGDATPIPDRKGSWRVIGPRPMFEVQKASENLPDSWTVVSFELSASRSQAARCFLYVKTGSKRDWLELGCSGKFSVVCRLSGCDSSIRILPITDKDTIDISPVALRPIGKVEAGIRLIFALFRTGGWRGVSAKTKRAVHMLRIGGWAGLRRWVVDQRILTQNARCGWFVAADLDLFNDADIANATGLERSGFLWTPQSASGIKDLWTAARYCVDLIRSRADMRQRFPDALSAGSSGAFAKWISSDGSNSLGLSLEARDRIREVLDAGVSNYVRQIYLTYEHLRDDFPLALTPAGRRDFFRWMVRDGRALPGVRLEAIWWFFLECAERPSAELVRTYLFTPYWQSRFPDGGTAFGRSKLASWLASHYRIDADWGNPASWPPIGTPAEEIRLAYAVHDSWRKGHPHAFASEKLIEGFLDWLRTQAALNRDALTWCREVNLQQIAKPPATGGVNILGHFCYISGLRTSVESISEGIKRAGLGVSLRDISHGFGDDPLHARYNGLEFYETTIIHTQPQPFFDAAYQRSGLHPRSPRTYRIAYWYWELDTVPKSWRAQAAQVDELWAATKFVADALRRSLHVPVFQMMPGLELPDFSVRTRSDFGLPDDKFIFLFVFHMMSISERKNPFALIDAYRQAFGKDERVMLILKTSFGEMHPDEMAALHAAAAGSGIMIIDAIYNRDETLSLMATADCYVSLHRSEGWGLTMAEAMLLGKPVIATGYSGNMEFMDDTNSLLVDYKMTSLDRDYPPYMAGLHWADPSIDHAAQQMRRVYEDQAWARDLGAKARADLRERMSIAAAGRRMAARLAEISQDRSRDDNRSLRTFCT